MAASQLENLQNLLLVQAVDTKLGRAQAALAALNTGAALAASYATDKKVFDKLKSVMLSAQGEQKDAELRLQSIETKTAQVNKTLFGGTVTGPRELENLQKEVEMLGRQKGEAEEKVLVTMEAASAATTEAEAAERALLALTEQYRTVRATYKERHATLSSEIAALQTERDAAVRSVPDSLLSRYNTIRTRKGNTGVASVESDGTCGACHIKLSTAHIDEIKAAQTFYTCEHCGRLLVPAPSLV